MPKDNIRAIARVGAGYEIAYEDSSQILHVRAPDGQLSLAITLGPAGIKLDLRGAALDIVADKQIRIACERFEVTTTDAIDLRSAGETRITAEQDVAISSHQDARIDGSRILLNSPNMRRPG